MAIFYQSRSPPALLHRSVFFSEQHTGGSTLHGGRKHGGGKLIAQWGIFLIKFNKQECNQGNLGVTCVIQKNWYLLPSSVLDSALARPSPST